MATQKFTESEIIAQFEREKPERTTFGNYRIVGERLEYHAQSSEEAERWYGAEEFQKAREAIGKRIAELDGKLVRKGKTVLLESLTAKDSSRDLRVQYTEVNTVAVKVKTPDGSLILGNSDTLELIGRTVAYGHVSENRSKTDIQWALERRGATMLPLSDFADADFDTFKIVARGDTLSVTYTRPSGYQNTTTHTALISALVFSLDGVSYLYDADRREARYGRLHLFLTKLPREVTSIADAYESLKPEAVVDAEKRGLKVKRIGPWFLIPTDAPALPKLSIEDRMRVLIANSGYGLDRDALLWLADGVISGAVPDKGDKKAERIKETIPYGRSLPARAGGPAYCSATRAVQWDGKFYCTGKIESRDRADLGLDQWYIAVPRLEAK